MSAEACDDFFVPSAILMTQDTKHVMRKHYHKKSLCQSLRPRGQRSTKVFSGRISADGVDDIQAEVSDENEIRDGNNFRWCRVSRGVGGK